MNNMKRNKKGEISIYVIALMLVTAGYFNYMQFNNETQETYSEELADTTNEKETNIGDAVLVNSNIQEEKESEDRVEIEEQNSVENNENAEGLKSQENIENKEIKEVVNEEIEKTKNEYYVSSKLDRDKMYAQMLSNYQNILNNEKVSEVQKSIATEEIKKINNTKNAIMICENLIQTKGFENCIIFVNGDSINVVVKIENGLTKENVAKIQNIISREIGATIENIHISEK